MLFDYSGPARVYFIPEGHTDIVVDDGHGGLIGIGENGAAPATLIGSNAEPLFRDREG